MQITGGEYAGVNDLSEATLQKDLRKHLRSLADKLDYMARDGHHAGLSVGLDTDRLLSKLEVITITPENVPPRLAELRRRAEESPQRRIYDMGISASGIGAYEQMIVGRVVLYDRLYFHHKVRGRRNGAAADPSRRGGKEVQSSPFRSFSWTCPTTR